MEIKFLKNPESFELITALMRHRVKTKAEEFRAQIALLQGCGAFAGNGLSVTENCNGVTEYCNGKQSLNQVDFNNWAPGMGFEPQFTSKKLCNQTNGKPSVIDPKRGGAASLFLFVPFVASVKSQVNKQQQYYHYQYHS